MSVQERLEAAKNSHNIYESIQAQIDVLAEVIDSLPRIRESTKLKEMEEELANLKRSHEELWGLTDSLLTRVEDLELQPESEQTKSEEAVSIPVTPPAAD